LPTEIGGFVASGFEPVRREFERNFSERGEIGAAFAVHRDGEQLVDLWGGMADLQTGRPWDAETLVCIFSGTKALVAMCVLMLLDRGSLELEAPVARYWPELRAKTVVVRDIVSHTARLPGVTQDVTIDEFADALHMAGLLEHEQQNEDPRAALCYHAFTYGWLCDGLVRRVDGRSVGRFFADEIALPLALDAWIGLPGELDSRVARLELADDWPQSPHLQAETLARDDLTRSIWGNPPVFDRGAFPWNDARYRRAEIPGAGAIATPRSMARLYASLPALVSPRTLELARTPWSEGPDVVHGAAQRFGVGFQLQTDALVLGPDTGAFGHGGAGGSIHGVWPSSGVGFSYGMNELRDRDALDPRSWTLLHALHSAL
jgi:CubicO group peptidase (beta-lactamase class C family)